MTTRPLISVILVSYNTADLTLESLAHLYNSRGFKPGQIEVIVVDNHSTDGTVSLVKTKYPQAILIESKSNLGFGAGNNLGVKAAKGEYLFFLNTDAFVEPNSLKDMYEAILTDSTILAVAPLLTYRDGSLQQSVGYFPTLPRLMAWMWGWDKLPLLKLAFPKPYHAYDLTTYSTGLRPDWLMGAAFLLRKCDFEAVAGFDPHIFMYGEEVELFYRLKQSLPSRTPMLIPSIRVKHLGGSSSNKAKVSKLVQEFRGLITLYRKHYPNLVSFAKFVIYTGVLIRIIIFSLIPTRHDTVKEYLKYL